MALTIKYIKTSQILKCITFFYCKIRRNSLTYHITEFRKKLTDIIIFLKDHAIQFNKITKSNGKQIVLSGNSIA